MPEEFRTSGDMLILSLYHFLLKETRNISYKTPPEMTQNDAAVYGRLGQEVDISKPGRCFGGRLKKEYYASWAKYLVKYSEQEVEVAVRVSGYLGKVKLAGKTMGSLQLDYKG